MTTSSERYSGQCLCGQIEFSWNGPSLWCAHCHCSRCRRAHGAAYVTWVGVDETRFRIDRGSVQWYESGTESRRGFCPACGSSLLFQSARWPGEMHVARALVDGPIDLQPQVHAFSETAVDWTRADPHLPRK